MGAETSASPRAARLAGSFAAFVWVLTFVSFLGADVTPYDMGLRATAILAFGVPVVITGAWVALRRPHPTDPWLALGLAAYLLVSVLSSDLTASLETLGLVTAYVGVFAIGVRLRRGPWRTSTATAVGSAVAIWAAIMAIRWGTDAVVWLASDGGWPPPNARNAVLWLSTDAVAALLILGAPYYFWIERRSLRLVLGGVAAVSAAVIVPLSGGRAEMLGLLAGTLVWMAISPWGRRRLTRRSVVVAAAVGCAVIAVVGVVLALKADPTLSGRTFIWSNTLALISTDPLTGSGPGTFSWARLDHGPADAPRIAVYHAHNLLLQTIADGGVILLAGFGLLVAALARPVLSQLSRLDGGGRMAIASLVAFAVVLLLDELTQLPTLATLAALQAGIVAGDVGGAYEPAKPRLLRAGLPLAFLLAAIVAVPAVMLVHTARVEAAAGRALATEGDWKGALQRFQSASSAWPTNGLYHMSVGLAQARLGAEEAAREAYATAAWLVPGDPRPWGALAELSDTVQERTDLLARAAQLGSGDAQYDYRLALELWGIGKDAEGQQAYARASLLNPQLLGIVPGGSDAAANVARAMIAIAADAADRGVESPGSAVAQARSVLGVSQPDDPLTAQALALARSGDMARALATARRAVDAREGADAYRAAVAIAELTCDKQMAVRHKRLLDLLNTGYARFYVAGFADGNRDHVYREIGLGDYQPTSADATGLRPNGWPGPLLPPPQCDRDAVR